MASFPSTVKTALRAIAHHPINLTLRVGRRMGWWAFSATVLGALILIGIAVKLLVPATTTSELAQSARFVEVRSVSGLLDDSSPLTIGGEVRSQSEAAVRTEGSGEVKAVYASLGDFVRAGQVIAELSNARERAAVLQSEGVYDAAVAQLSKVKGGTREEQLAILQATLQSAKDSYAGTQTGAVSTLLSAYSTIDDSVNRKADQMFTSPDTNTPKFTIQSTDSGLVSALENSRVRMGQILKREVGISATLSESDNLSTEITTTISEVREVKNFLDKLVDALNKAVPSQNIPDTTIAGYRSDANIARASVSALLTSLSGARDALSGKSTAVAIAQKNLEQGVVGGQPQDVAAAEASVKQAQGALAGARAALEKTIIRSPISGSINALPITRGDFVSAFEPAVTIANNKALEIVAYITETEARDVVVGTEVTIEGSAKGVITHLAPAVDPSTKKVEVHIGVSDPKGLINGQSVTLSFKRGKSTTTSSNTATASTRPITIPISALKVGSDKIVVFSVDQNNILVPHEVTIGTLLGDRVEIVGGIERDMQIVVDARGLKAGDQVTIKGQ